MEEFSEIEPGELKIEYAPHENGSCVVTLDPMYYSIPGTPRPRGVQAIPVAIANNGVILEMPSGYNSPYFRTHATYIVTDKEGMLGRNCPACKSYDPMLDYWLRMICGAFTLVGLWYLALALWPRKFAVAIPWFGWLMIVEGIILLVSGLRLGLGPFPFYGDVSACFGGGAGILFFARAAKP